MASKVRLLAVADVAETGHRPSPLWTNWGEFHRSGAARSSACCLVDVDVLVQVLIVAAKAVGSRSLLLSSARPSFCGVRPTD
jgi:hypothetical protein